MKPVEGPFHPLQGEARGTKDAEEAFLGQGFHKFFGSDAIGHGPAVIGEIDAMIATEGGITQLGPMAGKTQGNDGERAIASLGQRPSRVKHAVFIGIDRKRGRSVLQEVRKLRSRDGNGGVGCRHGTPRVGVGYGSSG